MLQPTPAPCCRRWLEAADWSGLFKSGRALRVPSAASATAAPGKAQPLLPPAQAELSPHGLAAITRDLDPRWLLQLESAWVVCPEFKLLFWEVLACKAGWQVDGLPEATATPPPAPSSLGANPLHRLMGAYQGKEEQGMPLTAEAMAKAAAAAAEAAAMQAEAAAGLAAHDACAGSGQSFPPSASTRVVVDPLLSLLVYHWPAWEQDAAKRSEEYVPQPPNAMQGVMSGNNKLLRREQPSGPADGAQQGTQQDGAISPPVQQTMETIEVSIGKQGQLSIEMEGVENAFEAMLEVAGRTHVGRWHAFSCISLATSCATCCATPCVACAA